MLANRILLVASLVLPLLSPQVEAQVEPCGACDSSVSDVTSATAGPITASIVVEETLDGECVTRNGCSQKVGCELVMRLSIVGGQGGNAHSFTYYGWEVEPGVEKEDADEDDYAAGGQGSTGTGGQSGSFSMTSGCNKVLYLEVSVLGGEATATLECEACPLVDPDPL